MDYAKYQLWLEARRSRANEKRRIEREYREYLEKNGIDEKVMMKERARERIRDKFWKLKSAARQLGWTVSMEEM